MGVYEDLIRIHRRADSFVARTWFYNAEDAESSEDMAVRRTFRPPQHEFSGRWPSELQRGQVTSCVSWLPALAPALAAKIHAAGCGKFDPPEDHSPSLLQVAT